MHPQDQLAGKTLPLRIRQRRWSAAVQFGCQQRRDLAVLQPGSTELPDAPTIDLREPPSRLYDAADALQPQARAVQTMLKAALEREMTPAQRQMLRHYARAVQCGAMSTAVLSLIPRRGATAPPPAREAAVRAAPTDELDQLRQHQEAARVHDLLRTRVTLLEARLAALQPPLSEEELRRELHRPGCRERYILLGHFRRRLHDYHGVQVSYRDVEQLNDHARHQPVHGYTPRGAPLKLLHVQGQAVYAVVTPDLEGLLTLTTALTEKMVGRPRSWGF